MANGYLRLFLNTQTGYFKLKSSLDFAGSYGGESDSQGEEPSTTGIYLDLELADQLGPQSLLIKQYLDEQYRVFLSETF